MAKDNSTEDEFVEEPVTPEPIAVSNWDAELAKPGRYVIGSNVVDGNGNICATRE